MRVRRRLKHMAAVLTFMPVIYVIESIVRGLNGQGMVPSPGFGRFIWDWLWETIEEDKLGVAYARGIAETEKDNLWREDVQLPTKG